MSVRNTAESPDGYLSKKSLGKKWISDLGSRTRSLIQAKQASACSPGPTQPRLAKPVSDLFGGFLFFPRIALP